jgi:hypothetical protein
MNAHGAFSIIANVKDENIDTLRNMLSKIDTDPEGNGMVVFRNIKSIHFARMLICPVCVDVYGSKIPNQLVFTTNYDIPLERHIEELVTQSGKGLWMILSQCETYPLGTYNPTTLLHFLTENNIKANTFYVGVGARSVDQIRMENDLRTTIESYIDNNRSDLLSGNAIDIRNKIKAFITSQASTQWSLKPTAKEPFSKSLINSFKLIGVIILCILLSPLLIPFVIVWMILILINEVNSKEVTCVCEKQHLNELLMRETGIVQNQFSARGNLKPGSLRLQTMKFLLRLTNFLAPYIFSKGKLSGIPTVHFARWLIINEGRQMLFLSNYDGNSESYLRDFIHIAAKQLTLLFSHTIGYPKTRLMVFGGAKDAKNFMLWARQNQLITNVWYSANPNVSLKNIIHNSKIRDGLYGEMTETQARQWLSLL